MIKLLLIGQDNDPMFEIEKQLEQFEDVDLTRAYSKWKVLDLIANRRFDSAMKRRGVCAADLLTGIDSIIQSIAKLV